MPVAALMAFARTAEARPKTGTVSAVAIVGPAARIPRRTAVPSPVIAGTAKGLTLLLALIRVKASPVALKILRLLAKRRSFLRTMRLLLGLLKQKIQFLFQKPHMFLNFAKLLQNFVLRNRRFHFGFAFGFERRHLLFDDVVLPGRIFLDSFLSAHVVPRRLK